MPNIQWELNGLWLGGRLLRVANDSFREMNSYNAMIALGYLATKDEI